MTGKLKLAGNKKTWLLVREDGKELQVPAKALSRALFPLDPQKHDGLEVEYELDKGQPSKIYQAGTEWQPQAVSTPAPARSQASPRGGGRYSDRERSSPPGRQPRFENARPQHAPPLPSAFHNPYNFIPAPPRNQKDLGDLGDGEPIGHDRYSESRWSGRISVKMETQTPLLLLDAGRAELFENDKKRDHKVFPVRLDATGQPYLPPTSIKGMLRSAYEAVTNSRLAVFDHPDRVAYRMAAKLGPIPARVEGPPGEEVLHVMPASVIGAAAKLRRYEVHTKDKDKGRKRVALSYRDGQFPEHGDPVWVQYSDKGRVTHIERRPDETAPAGKWTKGWVCITGPNIKQKLYERVFLEGPNDLFIPVEDKHRNLWRELILDYKKTHERDLKKRDLHEEKYDAYLGDQPDKTGWSRHIYEKDEWKLESGTLCYVEFIDDGKREISALIPVTISRRLHVASPNALLPDTLKPAQILKDLSPADRVFGWVNQQGNGAYRGNLRVGPVKCISPEAVCRFDKEGLPPLPLTILGQPKPQQARFYVAQSKQGGAQPNGITKEQAGYTLEKGLRGRKVYPHHAGLPDGYWEKPHEDRTQRAVNGHYQEYRRPADVRNDQNRSIQGWVKRSVTFEFSIDVVNLSDVELGALLWLLSLPDGHFHRLGGGKPLGFGSVRLSIDWADTDLRIGETWRRYYASLEDAGEPENSKARICVEAFEAEAHRIFGEGTPRRARLLTAFRRYANGFSDGLPLHYPRARQEGQRLDAPVPPQADGKNYEWFVANERTGRQGGPKLVLPDLEQDSGLPIL